MSLIFIHNPSSGSSKYAESIRAIRRSLGDGHSWIETSGPRDAVRLAREAAEGGAKTVVAVGGDGTVHEVVNGLMSVSQDERPALGILPVGTGNDFAFAVGPQKSLWDGVDRLLKGESRVVDIGSIEDERGRRWYWANSCGIGLNAKVTVRSLKYRSLKGNAKYVAASVVTLLRDPHAAEMEIALDDDRRISEELTLLTLGNGPREGGEFYMTPNAKIDDGLFDMLRVKPISRLGLLQLMPKAMKGTHLRSPNVSIEQFSTLHLKSPKPLVIHTDGEIFAEEGDDVREISVGVHPGVIRVIS